MKARRLCALLLCALLLSGCGAAPLSQSTAPALESAMPSAPAESPEATPASDVTVTEDLPDALRFSVSLPALPDSPYDLERCFSGADEHDCAFCYPDFCEQWVEDGVIRLSPRRFFGRIFLSSVRRDAPDAPQTLLSLLDTAKWGASANEMTVGSGHNGLRMSHLKYDTYRRWIVWETGDRYYTLYAACFDRYEDTINAVLDTIVASFLTQEELTGCSCAPGALLRQSRGLSLSYDSASLALTDEGFALRLLLRADSASDSPVVLSAGSAVCTISPGESALWPLELPLSGGGETTLSITARSDDADLADLGLELIIKET